METGGAFMISYEYGERQKWENIPIDWCSSLECPFRLKKKLSVYYMLGIVLEY